MKKKQFHCSICGNPCEIYKKGKNHRVLICPQHGIIASNPLPLAALAAMAAPTIIEGVGGLFSKKKGKRDGEEAPKMAFPRETYSTEERVRDALKSRW